MIALQGWMQGPWHGGGWIGGWFGWVGMLFAVAFYVLFAIALIALIRYLWTRKAGSGGGESPLDILKKRYARGDINRDEFERMRQELR